MNAIETITAIAAAIAAGATTGAGIAWGRRANGKRPPRSDPPAQVQAAPGFAPGDTGRHEIPVCGQHAAIEQRHRATEARLERIEGKVDYVAEALARIEGALSVQRERERVHTGGGRRA